MENLKTRIADMEFLPFNDEEFDSVCCAGSLSYGDNHLVMQEIYRVLNPGGIFLCVDSLNHNPIYWLNRWFHFLCGRRTKSTLLRMPTLSLINNYGRCFGYQIVKYLGAIVWLSPILHFLLGSKITAYCIERFDKLIDVKESAFKFVMVCRKVNR